MRKPLLWLCGALLVCHAQAQVYKVVQADGTVLYTDTPVEGAESLTLMEDDVNVAAPLASPSATPPPPPVEAKVTPRISVSSPEPEATIRNNDGQLTIVATSNLETPMYKLLLDGSIVATNNSGIFDLKNLNRGAHSFSVLLTDNKGRTLASTSPQTFYVHRASVFINRPR